MYLRPFKCNDCEASYTTNGELARHKRYKHGGGKPHKCDRCNYECVEMAKLQRHQRMHNGEKPFNCPSCDYSSYDKSKIRRHYVIHTREKPFACELCQARFTQSGSLKTHLAKVHHLNKVEFRCVFCNLFVTANMGELRNHMKMIHRVIDFPVVVNKEVVINPMEVQTQQNAEETEQISEEQIERNDSDLSNESKQIE
ncbi:transcriptional repressor CTCFL-like protein [Dinothrombium tinctorium]|uniref:Transcriptional repressor CTCFL-like protein n=1 Tax=Dinothrombium tinctorium TaxID=1965070 RepID=A0A443QMW6_9ACAR|nr:transcriptional repressor CTCFL-like protein [Dinothrombium tinctorium]